MQDMSKARERRVHIELCADDMWVGVYRGSKYWCICLVPFWVIKVRRRCGERGTAVVAMAKCTEPRGHELPHRNRRYGFAWHKASW
jgi:hypothetical protein